MASSYPKRQPFFSHRFTRLMGKVCIGAEIGPEACWLLSYIAHTEDAAGYRRAVTFYNADLATRLGMSISAMRRARDRAVEAGWLNYVEGAKRKPPQYHVSIPKWAEGIPDGAGDEDNLPSQIDAVSGKKAAGKRQQSDAVSGRNPAGIRQGSEQPSSLSQDNLSLTPSAAVAAGGTEIPNQPPPARKEPTGPHADAIRAFVSRWEAKYRDKYPFAPKDGVAIAAMLKRCDGDLAKFTAAVCRYLAETDQFYHGHGASLMNSKLERWLVAMKPRSNNASDQYASLLVEVANMPPPPEEYR